MKKLVTVTASASLIIDVEPNESVSERLASDKELSEQAFALLHADGLVITDIQEAE